MNLSAKTELLKRFSTAQHVAGLKSVVETAFALGSMVDSAKKRAADDLNLSDAGRAAHVAKIAVDTLRPLIESTAGARKASRFNADRKASLKPPTPARDDTVGEMRLLSLGPLDAAFKYPNGYNSRLRIPKRSSTLLGLCLVCQRINSKRFSKLILRASLVRKLRKLIPSTRIYRP
jgi:hypothetical protein